MTTPDLQELKAKKRARLTPVWDVMIQQQLLPMDIHLNAAEFYEYQDQHTEEQYLL